MSTETKADERESERQEVLLSARCRQSSWLVHRVELNDLSEGGCCIVGGAEALELDQDVVIRFADLKGIPGTVRWIEKGRAGIRFDTPLDAHLIAAIGQTYSHTIPRVTNIKKYAARG